MPIDIDQLTEAELRDLHHRITERLRMIQQLRAHGAMMNFAIGDRVTFMADGQRVDGVLTRYNKRTVTVIADGGGRWNVSPGLLQRAEVTKKAESVVVRTSVHAGNLLGRAGM